MKTTKIIMLVVALSFVGILYNAKDTIIAKFKSQPESPNEMPPEVELEKRWGPDYSGIRVRDLIVKDLKVGIGDKQIKEKSQIKLNYQAWVYDPARPKNRGVLISKSESKPSLFMLGKGQLIKGWEQGLIGLKKGAQRELIIPSHLAYGEKSTDRKIPPNAIILVELEVAEIL